MKTLAVLTISCLITLPLFSKVSIEDVKINSLSENQAEMVITLSEKTNQVAELMIRDNIVQISLTQSSVWPRMDKKATILSSLDTTVLSYQFDANVTRTRVLLPYSVTPEADRVAVNQAADVIRVTFPVIGKKEKITVAAPAKAQKGAEKYDEKYLEKLLGDKVDQVAVEEGSKNPELAKAAAPLKLAKDVKKMEEDGVKTTLAAPVKESDGEVKKAPQFSVLTYLGKFVLFLGILVAGFYGVINLLRKTAMSKGKLGFLNKTKTVEVLSTNYIAPKTALLTVRVHNQIFLIGNSDKGMQFLSEIKDTAGLLKNGEKEIAGNNFDMNLAEADVTQKEFRLKSLSPEEMVKEDDVISNLVKEVSNQKESVKFSDQIKRKVKGLKALQ